MAAKGLYVTIASLLESHPDTISKEAIQDQSGLGQYAFSRRWKQLKRGGYLRLIRYHDERGLLCYNYELHPAPVKDVPTTDLPAKVVAAYQRAFGTPPNTLRTNRYLNFLKRFQEDVVILAIELAGAKDRSNIAPFAILLDWEKGGAYTLADVITYEKRHGGYLFAKQFLPSQP